MSRGRGNELGLYDGVVSVLREVLDHPANRGRRLAATRRWALHNIRRRLTPGADITVTTSNGRLTGPIGHPSVNFAVYVPTGRHDAAAWAAFDALTDPGDTFIDVGASIGSYSVQIDRNIGPSGTIVAVEVDPVQIPYLMQNLGRLSATTVIANRAVADRRRTLAFVRQGPTIGHLDQRGDGEVVATTLDEVMEPLGPRPGTCILKIDVEGWEPAVVLGAARVLTTTKAVLLEARGFQDRCPVTWPEAVHTLRDLDFVFVWPDVRSGRLVEFDDPGPVAPDNEYLAIRDEHLGRVRAAGFLPEPAP